MDKLEEYWRKRRFDKTPEPPGAPEPAPKPESAGKKPRLPKPKLAILEGPTEQKLATDNIFVVQKHSATRLHYDFRLAVEGTLKSWAVPKGPSMSTADKRLAVLTEDHPLEYGGFEGKIPAGSYGAGTVMVWDRGGFLVEGNLSAEEQLGKGEIKFILHGEKLRGSFALVKMKHSEKGNEWLLLKHKDGLEDAAWQIDEHDGSVLTGRALGEIAEELPPKRSPNPIQASEVQGAEQRKMPPAIEPMLATLTSRAFSDPNWAFEIKWDGVRALAWLEHGALTLRSRNNVDITKRYPELASLPRQCGAGQAILDGEIVAFDDRGLSNFERLQERMHVRAPGETQVAQTPVTYCAFDLLYCDGYDLRGAPLVERKQLLRTLLYSSTSVRYSDHQIEQGKELYELARQHGLEGILAKRADSSYSSGRSLSWLKLKVTGTVDAVIGGWTAARSSGIPFGSLLLGLYEGKKLRFVGHVGSGFDAQKHKELSRRLKELGSPECPFDGVPATNEKPTWVSPELVARVKFSGWTQEHVLRHPAFLGLREDIAPEECRWESEASEPQPVASVVRAPEIVGRVLSGK